jgi:hypothetical protein
MLSVDDVKVCWIKSHPSLFLKCNWAELRQGNRFFCKLSCYDITDDGKMNCCLHCDRGPFRGREILGET